MRNRPIAWLPLALVVCGSAPATSAADLDWVTVAGADNDCDVQAARCFGAVPDIYQISRTEISNAQYADFLNAVAASDPNGLYNTAMGLFPGGIIREGDPGSYTFLAMAGREDKPVNFISFYDALRFANWLHNGQPIGPQDDTTTEDGAYTFSGPTSAGPRNALALVFLTSEDEWYKAAYYDASSASYFDYPASSDDATLCAEPGATANTANCGDAVEDLSDVGGYPGSASPNDTLDQGGNVWEWNESQSDTERGVRGGAFLSDSSALAASSRTGRSPSGEFENVGFRVATVPEPGKALLPMTGLVTLAFWRAHHLRAGPAR